MNDQAQLDPNPEVTCLQLSYGRPHLSVEAVCSYANQTYANKRLIIVNTHPDPVTKLVPDERCVGELSNITVKNTASEGLKFDRLSDVYRYALSLVETPLFMFWDDDDIYLPWHITSRVNAYLAAKFYFRDVTCVTHEVSFTSEENQIKNMGGNMFVSQYIHENNPSLRPDPGVACWDANWFYKDHVRATIYSSGMVGVGSGNAGVLVPTWYAIPSYIYRWATGENHISGQATEEGQHQNFLRNIEEKHKLKLPSTWFAGWSRNYVKDAADFSQTRVPMRVPTEMIERFK